MSNKDLINKKLMEIPAFAGMTEVFTGMTGDFARATKVFEVMTGVI